MSSDDYWGVDLNDLPPAFTRRPDGDGERPARDHPLYKNAVPKADGLFHCPWEGNRSCTHKPAKLKRDYNKFVYSHLKPYRCKVDSCENARFSSTACLLRHEREAHAMHGHRDRPYLCKFEWCEFAGPGNGFSREWDLRDHLRRVHEDDGQRLSLATPRHQGIHGPTTSSGDTCGPGQADSGNKRPRSDVASQLLADLSEAA